MKKIFLTLALTAGIMASAQVKIGDNATTLYANSLLELESTSKGVLFPRVELLSTSDATTVGAHVAGMTVYNKGLNIDAGMYTNNGVAWVKLGASAVSTLYTADGTLTGARTVTQNNNDLTFTTGTGKTIVNGTFKTNGGIYTKYRVATTLAEAFPLDDDYIIDVRISGAIAAFTGVLPDPAATPVGRVIVFRNSSLRAGAAGSYTFTGADLGYIVSAANIIASNLSMTLYCDGLKWVRIYE
jgi:hypothetical protein